MAKKPTITTIASGYYSRQALNNNFNALNDAFDNTLSRDGSTPNTMTADFDLNGQDLINVKDTYTTNLILGGVDFNASVAGSIAAAASSASDSAASAVEAATSATGASLSAAQAALYDGLWSEDVSSLLADTIITYTVGLPSSVVTGDYVLTRKEGFTYEVAASGATDEDITTAGGVKLYVKAGLSGYDLMAFGAAGDGLTNDSAAVTSWITALSAEKSVGVVPAGDYLLNSYVDLTFGAVSFSIAGSGRGASRFIVPSTNVGGGISITSTSRSSQVKFSGFSVITRGAGGQGLRFRQPEGGNQHQRSVIVRDVSIRGEDGTNDYFSNFLSLAGTWRPLVENVQIDGPFIGVDNSDASLRFASNVGIDLDGAYDPTVNDCHVWGASRGIRSDVYRGVITSFSDNGSGATRVTISNTWAHPFSTGSNIIISGSIAPYNGAQVVTNVSATQFDIPVVFTSTSTGEAYLSQEPEAFRLTNTVINGCLVGLDYIRPAGREPIVWIDNCHVNYRNEGFRIEGAKLVTIQASMPYNEDAANLYTGVAYDIHLVDASEFIITGNVFHFSGAADRINVKVENNGTAGSGDNGIVSHNIFNSVGSNAVWLSSGVTGVIVGPNIYSGTYSSNLVNDIGSENRIIDGKTETTGTWTPVLTFGDASVGITYSTRSGIYNISGGVLQYKIEIALTSKGTSVGIAELSLPTGLPGPLNVAANSGSGVLPIYAGMSSMVSPTARPVSSAKVRLANQGAGTITNVTDTNFGNTTSFTLTGTIFLS